MFEIFKGFSKGFVSLLAIIFLCTSILSQSTKVTAAFADEDQVFTRIENSQDIANQLYQQVNESGALEQGLAQMHKEFSPKLSYDMEKNIF
ncbi:hypothetical protein [Paenibacillus riograndensis]|uniref:hypothetical protein n=1 Tax=Paenibacillus riograndensis TaxID=483937 RepID=UPI0006261C36|nr:hypothetical protein [Paenibacillus riograndensis]